MMMCERKLQMNTRCALINKCAKASAFKLIITISPVDIIELSFFASLRTCILTLKTGQCPRQSGSSTSITITFTAIEDSSLIFKMMTSKDCPSCSCACNDELGEDTCSRLICCCHDGYVLLLLLYLPLLCHSGRVRGGGDFYTLSELVQNHARTEDLGIWIWIFYVDARFEEHDVKELPMIGHNG